MLRQQCAVCCMLLFNVSLMQLLVLLVADMRRHLQALLLEPIVKAF